jgi:hypothetical protein
MESDSVRRKDVISNFLIALVVFSGIFLACTKSAKIETLKKDSESDENFDDLEESNWIPGYGDTATMIGNIPKETLRKYLNTNAALEYNFEFLRFEKQGDVIFSGENAQIQIEGIPIGQQGTVKIEILEDGTAKLVGSKEDVTFKKGKNNQSIDLKQIESGNSDEDSNNSDQDSEEAGTLILTLDIKDSQSGNQGDNSGDSGNEGNFATEILPLARSFCNDCHAKFGLAVPNTEEYFAARKSSLTARLSKSASNTMPQRGSQEAQRMSDEDREVLISYIKSL